MRSWIKKMLAVAALCIPVMFTASVYAQTQGAPAGGEEKGAATATQPEKKTEVKKARKVKKHLRKHVKKHVKKAPEKADKTKAPAGTESAPAGK